MKGFFPEVSRTIDLLHIHFEPQELINDFAGKHHRRVDIVARTWLKNEPKDEEHFIVVHVEPQSYVQTNFGERMFIYFARLYEKYHKRVLPVAVFTYDQKREEPDTFEVTFPFLDAHALEFRFCTLVLKNKHWQDYRNTDNPAVAALMSKMHFSEAEKVQLKLEFTRTLGRLQPKLDPARLEFLTAFFDTYVKLTPEQEDQFEAELKKLGTKEVKALMEITTSWHEKGRAQGRMEGRVEGEVKGLQTAIQKFLTNRFGEVSGDVRQKLQRVKSVELLGKIIDKLYQGAGIEEVERLLQASLPEH